MEVIEWIDRHDGFAVSALTLALVVATVALAIVTLRSNRITRSALRLAEEQYELEPRSMLTQEQRMGFAHPRWMEMGRGGG